MNKIVFFLFIILFLLTCGIRLYHLSSPVADWHSWRQVDTAAVARNFLRFGLDPMHPRYDDLSNIQTGKDNPQGWRMVEFPIYQVVGVVAYKAFPRLSLEEWLRLVSIVSTAGSVVLLGLLLIDLVGVFEGVIGAFIYAILPFSIYYGRTILPDPSATFFALLSLYLLVKSDQKKQWFWWVTAAGVSAAISLLIRPMAAFLLLPSIYLIGKNNLFSKSTITKFFVYGIIALVPLLLWRYWISRYPEGIPASDWLFNKDNIRFKGAWFYWLFSQRLGDLILGYWGLIPFGLGIILMNKKKEGLFSLLWLSGMVLYFIIFAGGNVQHDYYQALMIPVVVWFVAKGLAYLFHRVNDWSFIASIILALVSVVFMWMFSWYTIRTYFWINRPEIVEAGKLADRILPKNAKVIAPYNGDTTFLYQTGRQGWPIGFDIDKKIAMGAQYYVTVSPTDNDLETKALAKKYTVLVRNDKFAIIDLTKKK